MKRNSPLEPADEFMAGIKAILRIVWAMTVLAIAVISFCIVRDYIDLSRFGQHLMTTSISLLWIFVSIVEWAERYENKSSIPKLALIIFTALSGFAVLCAVSEDTFEWAIWLNLLLSASCGVAIFAKLEHKMEVKNEKKKDEQKIVH